MNTAIRLLFAVSAAGVLLISSSCRSYPFEFADMCEFPDGTEPVICRKAAPSGYMVQANMVMENIFFSFSGIMMLRKQGGNLSLAVMLPAGAKVLEASGKAGVPEKWYFMPGMLPENTEQEKVAAMLLRDMANIFGDGSFVYRGKTPGTEERYSSGGLETNHPATGEKRLYGSEKWRLMRKSVKNRSCDWQSCYFRCIVSDGWLYPDQIVYDNNVERYRIVLRVQGFQVDE